MKEKKIFNDYSNAEIKTIKQKIIGSREIPEDIKAPILIWLNNAIEEQKWRHNQRIRQLHDSWIQDKGYFLRVSLSRWWGISFLFFLSLTVLIVGYLFFYLIVENIRYQYGHFIFIKMFDYLSINNDFIQKFTFTFISIIILSLILSFFLGKLISRHRADKKYGKAFTFDEEDLPSICDFD